MKLLDCTFRDGGYYTKWNFDSSVVNNYLKAMESSNVDIVEIGFRYTPKKEELGQFAYSSDDFISSLPISTSYDLAVMINAKDFITYPEGPKRCVQDLFGQCKDSPINIVRIASYINQINSCQSIADTLREMGYQVTLNVMQIANKSEESIKRAVESIKSWESVDVLYIADSLGSMDKTEIDRVLDISKDIWDGDIGFHGHNNKENALSNTFHSIDKNANWVDGTIMGMGRGAGNTHMEHLIVDLKDRGFSQYNPKPICSLVVNDFQNIYDKHLWGPNLYYHLSATYGIHPTYIQDLLSLGIYSTEQILAGIENLRKAKNPNSFNKDVLTISMVDHFVGEKENIMNTKIIIPARYKSSRFPGKSLVDLRGKSLIERVWERCCLALPKEDVFVATEDDSIREHCEERGIQVIMTTDKCLTGTDRVYEASLNIDADLIVNVQGDEPLVSPDDILKVINTYRENPTYVCCGMCPISFEDDFRSSSVPKVVTKDNGDLLYMSRAAIPTNKQLGFEKAMKQVCIYAFPQKALKDFGQSKEKSRLEQIEDIEILRFFELGYNIKMVETSQSSIAVDYPKDVERVVKAIEEYENIHG